MIKQLFKAAGVSFEGRQEILKSLAETGLWRDITVKLTSYEGEDALMLIDYDTKQQLGWVPKNLVPQYKGTRRMAGKILLGKRNTGLQLFPHQEPTQKQYWAVRRYCEKHNKPLPRYTRAAYEAMFLTMRSED